MNTFTKTAVAITLVAATSSASAWGQREQGALLGLVIGGAAVAIANDNDNRQYEPHHQRHQPAPVYVQPQPVYIQPQPQICGYNIHCSPTVCTNEPMYNQWNQIIGYRQTCR